MKDRKDIDKKYTWNLDKIYSSINDFDNDYISTGSDMTEGATNKIETTQGQIQQRSI